VVIALLLGYIVVMGVPNLKWSLFDPVYNSTNVSMLPSIVNTCEMTVLSLLISAPLGIGAAIFLSEYVKQGRGFGGIVTTLIRLAAETLAGVPSIIYGLFGMLLFVTQLQFGYSLLSGVLTLSIMTLPLIMRTCEEALLAIPMALREGAFALGAGKVRTIFCVVLPSAAPGILAGIILSVGRIVGETAALIFTAGAFQPKLTSGLLEPARTLSVQMYTLSSEGLHNNEAFATALVLLVLVLIINSASMALTKVLVGGKQNG
jgi:phosphate transport system permease protein